MAAPRSDVAVRERSQVVTWDRLVRGSFDLLLGRLGRPDGIATMVVLVSDADLGPLLGDLRDAAAALVPAVRLSPFVGSDLGGRLDRSAGGSPLCDAASLPHLMTIDRIDRVGGRRRQAAAASFLDAVATAGISTCLTVGRAALSQGLTPVLDSRLAAGLVILVPCRPDGLERERTPSLSMKRILRAAARQYGIEPAMLIGPGRSRTTVEVRNLAMYLSRRLTGASLDRIGDAFGGREHTTVLRGIRSIESRLATDASFATDVEGLVAVTCGSQRPGASAREIRSIG